MMVLIRKELREIRRPILIGAYAILGLEVLGWWVGANGRFGWLSPVAWLLALAFPPAVGLWLGARAVAKERAHRTLEFQSVWPTSQAQWWLAKLVASVLVLALALALALGLIWLWMVRMEGSTGPGTPPPFDDMAAFYASVCCPALLVFSVAFLMSSLVRSTFGALAFSLLGAGMVWAGWDIAISRLLPAWYGPSLPMPASAAYRLVGPVTGLILGAACLVAAGWATFSTPPFSFRRRARRGSLLACAIVIPVVGALLLSAPRLVPPAKADLGQIGNVKLSPDGTMIAFMDHYGAEYEKDAWKQSRLWGLRADGSDVHCIARAPVLHYQWVAGDRRVVCNWGHSWPSLFDRTARGLWWWAVDFASGPVRQLPVPGDKAISLSPKGTYATSGNELVDLRTFRRVGTLPTLPAGVGRWRSRAWSRDDTARYFPRDVKSHHGITRHVVDRIDLQSCKLTRDVYEAPRGDTIRALRKQGPWLVLERTKPQSITLVNIHDRRKITVAGATIFPRWLTPDGRYAWLHDRTHVFVVDLQTGKVVRRLGGPGLFAEIDDAPPFNSPDDKYVAFRAAPAGGHANWYYVTSPDGSMALKLLSIGRNGKDRERVLGWTAGDRLLLGHVEKGPERQASGALAYDRLATLSLSGKVATILTAPAKAGEQPS